MHNFMCENPYTCTCSVDIRYLSPNTLHGLRNEQTQITVRLSSGLYSQYVIGRYGGAEYTSLKRGSLLEIRKLYLSLLSYHRTVSDWAAVCETPSLSPVVNQYFANLLVCYPREQNNGQVIIPYCALYSGALIFCGGLWPKQVDRRRILKELISIGLEIHTVCEHVYNCADKQRQKHERQNQNYYS